MQKQIETLKRAACRLDQLVIRASLPFGPPVSGQARQADGVRTRAIPY